MSEPRRPTPWEILAFARSGKPAAEAPPAVAEALDERFRRFVENGQAAQAAIDALGAGPPPAPAGDCGHPIDHGGTSRLCRACQRAKDRRESDARAGIAPPAPSSAAADVAADDAAFGPWRRCLGGAALDCQAWARGDRGCPKHQAELPAVQGAPGAQRHQPTTPARPAALPRVAGRAGSSNGATMPPAPRTGKRR